MNMKSFALTMACSFIPAIAFSQGASAHVTGRILAQKTMHVSEAAALKAISDAGAKATVSISQLGVYVLSAPEPQLQGIMNKLSKSGAFTYVETDGVAKHGSVVPNDPGFPSQWHLGAINASAAWSVTEGSTSVPIAMVDSGVNPTHPDLVSKLIPGWNFLLGNSNTADDLGHGTATAGAAAAATNNGIGIAGVGWNTPIMPLVVLDSTDSASYSNIASAITYAADHGVRIINVSIGGSSSSSTLQSAVNYAWNKGAVVFAAAMNNATSAPYYPAACDNVIAVSATEPGNTLASFSNYGSWIDLAAPGDTIYTTDNSGGYSYWYGTSFSSPIAAATGALALSINPKLSAQSLVNLLEQNADDIGTTGFDTSFGWGLVDAYKVAFAALSSLSGDTTPPAVSISSPGPGATVSGVVQITGTATDNVGVVQAQLWVDGVLNSTCGSVGFSCSWNTSSAAAGSHTVTVKASDAAGNVGSASATLTVAFAALSLADTIPPTVQIQNPLNGTTVSGNVSVKVSASDNVGVVQVSIYIDNVLKSTLTGAPYSWSWNTKKSRTGSHNVSATAWDAAGNNATASVTVTSR